MRFTEHEMTLAVDAVGRHLYAATRPPWRRGDAGAAYDSLGKAQSYPHKAAAGAVVLPVLMALPERPTVGATPEFTDEEYAAAAEAGSGGAWDAMPARRRRRVAEETVRLTRVAVAAMPLRQDPDALIVPPHP